MDPNNRLHLNFGNHNDRLGAATDRAYPTTPSTFPQPVFPGGSSQQQAYSSQPGGGQQQQYASAGYSTPGNYFVPNQYQQQYGGQQPPSDYLSAPGAGYQPRSNTPGTNDPNVGLAHQFSHQNLGGASPRLNPYGVRGPSPAQRPRTAGSSGQQHQQGYLHAPMPTSGARPASADFQPAPERNPEKYGTNANNNQKKCSQLAADFFKDSVKRARERNQRCVSYSVEEKGDHRMPSRKY